MCTNCWLVQTEDFVQPERVFGDDYAYFSSVSKTWLEHAALYTKQVTKRLGLDQNSFVIEIAANDGYLLKNFVVAGVPCLGIEPTASTAAYAEKLGIPIVQKFFSKKLGLDLQFQKRQADLIIGNNVYAHVPDINDFTAGLKAALKPNGTVTLEFPHLMRLVEHRQFDTLYHEHFSYLLLGTVNRIFKSVGLKITDVEELPTHGGSLRIFGCHEERQIQIEQKVDQLISSELQHGFNDVRIYKGFQQQANIVKNNLITFLIEKYNQGKTVAGYGAAAKGNTLLNYAGIKKDLLPYVCDAAPYKQDKYLPGSRIPVLHPNVLKELKPNYVLILPWNIAPEIQAEHDYIRDWGGKFVVAVPHLRELP